MPATPSDPRSADRDEVLAVLTPSPLRRVAGAGVLAALAALLLDLGLAHPPAALILQLFALALAAGAAWLGWQFWHATAATLELTRHCLRERDGRCLALVADMRMVRGGVFAFKPSSGFVITLAAAAPPAFAPGLWWRLGRSLGVGGGTARHAARAMADTLTVLLTLPR
ncbi:MAG: hypothetical protein Q8O82_02755 [Pseudorhodobacter sp.]|nr:hypothetical protein [Pseudorhodobacter sp.]